MALQVYFQDDIAQGIVSVTVAMLSAAIAHGGSNVEYCRGVLDAARAQAANYGIAWTSVLDRLRELLPIGQRDDLLALIELALPARA